MGNVNGSVNMLNLDLNSEAKEFNADFQYATSKLCQILYSNALARKLDSYNVQSVALNPGKTTSQYKILFTRSHYM